MLSFAILKLSASCARRFQLHLHSSGYIPSKTSCDRAATFSSATATQLHSVDARHLPLALRPLAKVLKPRWYYEGVEPAHVSASTKIQNASESSKCSHGFCLLHAVRRQLRFVIPPLLCHVSCYSPSCTKGSAFVNSRYCNKISGLCSKHGFLYEDSW